MNGVDFGVFLVPEDNYYETLKTRGLVGDPETVTKRISEYVDEGAALFILSFLGGDWEREARLFMGEVASEFR